MLTWRQPPTVTARASVDVGAVNAYVRTDSMWAATYVVVQCCGGIMARRRRLPPWPSPLPLGAQSATSADLKTPSRELSPGNAAAATGAASQQPPAAATGSSPAAAATDEPAAADEPAEADEPAAADEPAEAAPQAAVPPSARFQVEAHGSLAAASKFELLAPDDTVSAALRGSGVTLLVTTDPLPGSGGGGGRLGSTSALRNKGGKGGEGGAAASGSAFAGAGAFPGAGAGTASAAATPEALRHSREVPPTPRSAGTWLRGGRAGSGGFGSGGGAPAPVALAVPLLAELSCRLDLGSLSAVVACDGGGGSGNAGGSAEAAASGSAAGEMKPPAMADDPFAEVAAAEAAPLDSAQPAAAQAALLEVLAVKTFHVDLVPSPSASAAPIATGTAVELEGAFCWPHIETLCLQLLKRCGAAWSWHPLNPRS